MLLLEKHQSAYSLHGEREMHMGFLFRQQIYVEYQVQFLLQACYTCHSFLHGYCLYAGKIACTPPRMTSASVLLASQANLHVHSYRAQLILLSSASFSKGMAFLARINAEYMCVGILGMTKEQSPMNSSCSGHQSVTFVIVRSLAEIHSQFSCFNQAPFTRFSNFSPSH